MVIQSFPKFSSIVIGLSGTPLSSRYSEFSLPYPPFQKKRSCTNKIAFNLYQGGTAVDAVEVAVRVLEDDPTFDAGHGSVLTEELTVEVDAMIMDGNTLESGTKALCFLALIVGNL